MEWVILLIVFVGATAFAYSAGKKQSPAQQKIDELESVIVEKESQLQSYQQKINHHFERSANLFSKVTDDYEKLYQYMAQSSESLGNAQVFKRALENKPSIAVPTSEPEEFNGEDTFSDENLYRAHDYRNQETIDEEESKEESSTADIIQLEDKKPSSESKKGQAPLDYAIKENGVINHNSLNMENVKT
ncbi:MAG: DUF1043 family protein [Gammaproteobacteria bacterium]|nr:DUF1043 family protein [Gammaproteobacteria bacterium]